VSNHTHIVLSVDPEAVHGWTDAEVVDRWLRVFPGAMAQASSDEQRLRVRMSLLRTPDHLKEIRQQPQRRPAILSTGESAYLFTSQKTFSGFQRPSKLRNRRFAGRQVLRFMPKPKNSDSVQIVAVLRCSRPEPANTDGRPVLQTVFGLWTPCTDPTRKRRSKSDISVPFGTKFM